MSSVRVSRRISSIALAVFFSLCLSGCEMLLGAGVSERYPVQGRLVDVGGRNLQIDCRGTGSPIVVLESGGDMYGSLAWTSIHDRIAGSTRVCAYSRAGIMWSDTRTSTLTDDSIARDLRAALSAAGEQAPYVLVGASRGAIYNLIFTDLFPDAVSGIVFVDPSHPEQVARYAAAGMDISDELAWSVRVGRAFRWTGLPRLVSDRFTVPSLSDQINETYTAYFPHSLDGYVSEKKALEAVRKRAATVHDLGARPVIVLTRQLPSSAVPNRDSSDFARFEKWEALWRQLHVEMAAWSRRGEQRIVPDSDHGMQYSRPDAVIDAIEDVVTTVRNDVSSR